MSSSYEQVKAFTLIELSIVLVVIGLLVGGVLVGRDLLSAAAIRAQISQIQQYQNAVTTFKGKYGYLPGDIKDPDATRFGFAPRGPLAGEGDGNGQLEGNCQNVYNSGFYMGCGESVMFWADLSTVRLIDGSFSTATVGTNPGTLTATAMSSYLPESKLGKGNFLYVYSMNYTNYFGLSIATGISNGWLFTSLPGTSVQQAYAIDSKIDDSKPLTGNVTNAYSSGGGLYWGIGAPLSYQGGAGDPTYYPYASLTSTSCMDHGSVPLASSTLSDYSYSLVNTGMNCALSFKFQ